MKARRMKGKDNRLSTAHCAVLLATTTFLAAGVSCGGGDEAPAADEQAVSLLDYQTVLPTGWQMHPPQSNMRLAEFRIPAPDAPAEGVEVVVFYFGPDEGGSVEANIERWTGQFTTAEGGSPTPAVESIDAEFPTTLVQLEGTYRRGIGMAPDAEPKPDQMLLAAVVETPDGNLHIQMHGPAAAVRAQRDAFLQFVRSIAPK